MQKNIIMLKNKYLKIFKTWRKTLTPRQSYLRGLHGNSLLYQRRADYIGKAIGGIQKDRCRCMSG